MSLESAVDTAGSRSVAVVAAVTVVSCAQTPPKILTINSETGLETVRSHLVILGIMSNRDITTTV